LQEALQEAYRDSKFFGMLNTQKEKGDSPTALFTDIDNTFSRADRVEATKELERKSEEENIPIISVTGNSFEGVLKRIERGELPYFSVIAGSVGTEIWLLHETPEGEKEKEYKKEYKKDTFFEKKLRESGFKRGEIAAKGSQMVADLRRVHPEWGIDFQQPGKERELLEKADPEYQPFKVSFYFYASPGSVEEVAKEVATRFPSQSLVVCEEINYNRRLPSDAPMRKYCLDILPISKGETVAYLSKLAEIKQGIVAGDSGNDTDMLLETGSLNAVLVGGYKPEAKEAVDKAVDKAVIKRKLGKRSFQKIISPEGEVKAIYIEQDPARLGPESILRAAEILQRAANIKKIRKNL